MTRQIIHQEQHIPASVHRLDAVLRAKYAAARTDVERDSLLRTRSDIKRYLVTVPDNELDAAAHDVLAELERRVRDYVSRAAAR